MGRTNQISSGSGCGLARESADAVCLRIEHLTTKVFEPLAVSSDGWDALYRDPADGRLWERTYPSSELHGAAHLGSN